MDVGTGLALLGSAKLLEKMLGPTAEYIGDGLQTWAEKRTENVRRIFSISERKLGDRIEIEGSVPPKVLKGILSEGSVCDDTVTAEYFGGVLASSRSGISRDDRGASFIALISRLSAYQVRAHYVLYHIIKNLFNGKDINPLKFSGRKEMESSIALDAFDGAMNFNQSEQLYILVPHIFYGLQRELLIENRFTYPSEKQFIEYADNVSVPEIIFQPSPFGIELFLWAHGRSDLNPQEFFKTEIEFDDHKFIDIPPAYGKAKG